MEADLVAVSKKPGKQLMESRISKQMRSNSPSCQRDATRRRPNGQVPSTGCGGAFLRGAGIAQNKQDL